MKPSRYNKMAVLPKPINGARKGWAHQRHEDRRAKGLAASCNVG